MGEPMRCACGVGSGVMILHGWVQDGSGHVCIWCGERLMPAGEVSHGTQEVVGVEGRGVEEEAQQEGGEGEEGRSGVDGASGCGEGGGDLER